MGEKDFEEKWMFRDWEKEKYVEGKAIVSKTEEMTFEDFVLLNLGTNAEGTKSDKHNACVSYLKECEQAEGFATECYVRSLGERLMYWYEYEVSFEPGSTVKNKVTAPIYPSIETAYDPPIYEYVYLLSPAKLWKDFGNIEIIIHTPAYMTDCSINGFEKIEGGYRIQRHELPQEELEFSLSESENSRMDPDIRRYRIMWTFYQVGIPILFIGGITAVIGFMIRRSRKKEQ